MDQAATRKLQGTTLTRLATLNDAGINTTARTVELAFSSEYDEGERSFGIEVLGHAPGEVDLSRLNSSAAVLLNHDTTKQIGVVVSASIDSDRVGRAVVRFGNSPLAREIFQDIADGIRKHVSVGYRLLEAELDGERDGVSVIRVTRWMPYEISIVPVPFDHTVGIGRSAIPSNTSSKSASTQNREHNPPAIMNPALIQSLHRSMGGDAHLARNAIANGLRQARNAVATPGVSNPTAGAMAYINLGDVMSAHAPSEKRSYGLSVTARPAGETMTFGAEILRASRVIQAGALLIPIADAPATVENTQGVVAWYKRESSFVVIKPATFSTVPDNANVAESELPLVAADINLGESAAQAVHFKISRADQKAIPDEVLQFEIERALVLGLAQLADKTLLDAVVASNPAAYSLAAAAASGARFAELRALVGTSGNGGVVNAAGNLVAAGVPAELTSQTALTYAGLFHRSAIACEREVRVLLKRMDLMGNLEVSVFANMTAVLPSPATFWKVPA
jgi:HK97 family phage prohead protease